MNKSILAASLALAGSLAFAGSAEAAKLVLLNVDPPGSGLNDTTVRAPEGANPGKTVGAQRRIVYQFAMDLWGSVLKSNVDVKIYASFQPLTCDAGSGVLGSAGTNWITYNFPGARKDTLYHSALGDAIAGFDLVPDPADPGDIASRFNSSLGGTNPDGSACLTGSGWYYGLDGNTPAGMISFLDVVMHEIGHGLGVSGFIDKNTGALGFGTGLTDVYTHNAYDNVRHLRFDSKLMDNNARAVAVRTPGRLVWAGQLVNATAADTLDHLVSFRVTAPTGIAGTYTYGTANFGPSATAGNFGLNEVVLVNDGVGSANDGCETPFVNAAAVAGKIALIDRGTCGFAVKAKNAQLAGAVAVIVANNQAGGAIGLGGSDPTVTIPTVSISQADGTTFKANLPVTVGFVEDPNRLQGADTAGRVQLYAPTVVAGGSSFSHIDTAATPNALMEPFISDSLASNFNIDLTPSLLTDVGWARNGGTAKIRACDTGVPIELAGGLIPGANVQAADTACVRNVSPARSSTAYKVCMTNFADKLQAAGLIDEAQDASLRACIGPVNSPAPAGLRRSK